MPIELDLEDAGQREVYRFISNMFLHQDRLLWGRLQTLAIIEGSSLTAAFAVLGKLGASIVALGTVLIGMAFTLATRDTEVRDHLRKEYLDPVHDKLQIYLAPLKVAPTGRSTLKWLCIILVLLNAVLAVALFSGWNPRATSNASSTTQSASSVK